MGKIRGQSSWPGRWPGSLSVAQVCLAVIAECPCVPGPDSGSLARSMESVEGERLRLHCPELGLPRGHHQLKEAHCGRRAKETAVDSIETT